MMITCGRRASNKGEHFVFRGAFIGESPRGAPPTVGPHSGGATYFEYLAAFKHQAVDPLYKACRVFELPAFGQYCLFE